jgi:hypothetical protein
MLYFFVRFQAAYAGPGPILYLRFEEVNFSRYERAQGHWESANQGAALEA